MSVLSVKGLEEQMFDVSLEESPTASSLQDDVDCDLCGKIDDCDDIPVAPDINGDLYSLKLKSAGLFRCSQTGIKFEVTRRVTIEYELDSWNHYTKHLPHKGSEVLGPLFKVTTPLPPHTVSAVYLPHNLCLKKFDGDSSSIRCAHFKDGDLCVETPTRILPFHVVLENPSFSSLGVFFWKVWNFLPEFLTKRIPIHGKVLLYFQTVGIEYMEFKFHLYLMPIFAPVNVEDFRKEKARNGFKDLGKSSKTTKPVYIKQNYIVNCSVAAHITNKELEVECDAPLEIYAEITIDAAVQVIDLWLVKEGDTVKVWECRLSKGELEQSHPPFPRRSQGGVEELRPQLPQNTEPQDEDEELRPQVPQNTEPQGRRAKTTIQGELQRQKSEFINKLRQLMAQNQLTKEQFYQIRSQATLEAMIRELYGILKMHSISGSRTHLQGYETQFHMEDERFDNRMIDGSNLSGSEYKEIQVNNLIRTSNGSDFESDEMPEETDSEPDVTDLESFGLLRPQRHFVDEQREALIDMVPRVAPILDTLLSAGLLNNEDYKAILAERTSQDQMRSLYSYVRSWKDPQKDIFYKALKIKYPVLVNNLEQQWP